MVYVTQEQEGKNIVTATKYGEITFLAEKGDQMSFQTEDLVEKITMKLQGFNDMDYLLLIGDPAIIGVAVAIAAICNEGKVSLLKWDRQDKMYYAVNVNINGGEINGNK